MQRAERPAGVLPAVAFPSGGEYLFRPLGDEGIEIPARFTTSQ